METRRLYSSDLGSFLALPGAASSDKYLFNAAVTEGNTAALFIDNSLVCCALTLPGADVDSRVWGSEVVFLFGGNGKQKAIKALINAAVTGCENAVIMLHPCNTPAAAALFELFPHGVIKDWLITHKGRVKLVFDICGELPKKCIMHISVNDTAGITKLLRDGFYICGIRDGKYLLAA